MDLKSSAAPYGRSEGTNFGLALLLPRLVYSANFLMVCVGLAGVCFAMLKTLAGHISSGLIMTAGAALALIVIRFALRIRSQRAFLGVTSFCWLISRSIVVALFPNYVLPGDEGYFHSFVGKLVPALHEGTVPALSNIYDFPVWLSRAFPFYLPLAMLFGPNDLWAARLLNVTLGAAQLVFLFFIAKMLAGGRIARLTCLLMLIFPYHWINVLSYDPQIAGTFFLLLAIWMFLCLLRKSSYSALSLASLGLCLALSLLFAGIQRGGIDLLLVGVMTVVLLSLSLYPAYGIARSNLVVCLVAVFLIWFPLRSAFGHWVASQDANLLRSHTLGFMARGWNLESSGEYLPLYEQLDVVSAKAEKQRTLEAVLVTEFARQPVRALAVLPFVKIAKFFALGYASTAETGLSEGGYAQATLIYQSLRSIYAPVVLFLCVLGLLVCWQNRRLELRLIVPVLLMVVSCAAIVLIWETSPRYSHPVQFAVLMLASIGLARFSPASVSFRRATHAIVQIGSGGLAITGCWLLVSVLIFAAAHAATAFQFVDPRRLTAELDNHPVQVEPLNPFSKSWEGDVRLPAGTILPATVRVFFPEPPSSNWNHLSVSMWQPNPELKEERDYAVDWTDGQTAGHLPSAASGRISRAEIPKVGNHPASLTLLIRPSGEHTKTESAMKIAIGYALVIN